MLSNERIKELIEDIDKNSPWIIDATQDTVEHLNDKGLLREPEVEVPYLDIKEGDRIHLVYKTGDTDGPTEEIYVADHDRDYNGWSMPDEDFTFFLIDRPEPPKPGVEDLAPGVRFTARFLGGVLREYVSLKGGTVLALASGEAPIFAINNQFTVEEVHD